MSEILITVRPGEGGADARRLAAWLSEVYLRRARRAA
jgi:protein subunit release factor B